MEKMIWKSGKIAREETLYINRDDKEKKQTKELEVLESKNKD